MRVALPFLVICSVACGQTLTVTGTVSLVRGKGAKAGKTDNSNAVVWLKSMEESALPKPVIPKPKFKIIQQHKRFEPHVLAVPAGSVVDFPNLDPFFHNVFSLFDGKRFDLGLYEAGGSHGVTFDRPGICYIFCNIHPEMSAIVVVLDTPHFGVTNQAGDFSVPGVPPGRYSVHVWHERAKPVSAGELPSPVTLSEGNTSLRAIRLADTGQLIVPHKNKYGRDYDPPASSPVYK